MKLGLLYELQIPKPWTPGIEARTYAEAMEQIVLADELGWEHVWAVEHHLLPQWSHSSAPEVFFGALSQRTKRIRIGHGIALLPKNFNHPFRVAERVAVLDILSGGRAELGTGRAVTLQELDGFQIDPAETMAQWEEAIEIIVRAFRDEAVEYKGTFYDIPPSYVVPKPVQKPHPPLWLAGTNPETFERAGRKGMGVLGFVTGSPEDVEGRVRTYKKAVEGAEPVGDAVNDQAAVLIQAYCAESREQAYADVEEAVARVAQLSVELFLPWAQHPDRAGDSYRYLSQPAASGTRTGAATGGGVAEQARAGITAVGTPDDLLALFERYADMGVDQMLTWVQFGGMPHDKIMRSMQMIGEHVIPKLPA